MLKQTDTVLLAWLNQAIASTGPYNPAALYAGLASAIADNGGATVIGDVTEATGAVGTRKAVTPWGDPYKMLDGRWVVDGPLLIWSPLNSTQAQSVTSWFLASALTAGVLKAFGPLPTTYNLIDENSQISIVPRITIDPGGRFSAEIVFNG